MKRILCSSPLGELTLVSNGHALTHILFPDQPLGSSATQAESGEDEVLLTAQRELAEYFGGKRQRFSVPTSAAGTAFQTQVWDALAEIPFGELRSYRDIAVSIQKPKAVRAVGAANGRNPLPIIVPCHRVIGSDGSLTGFAGGMAAKRLLLELENSAPPESQALF